MTTSSVLINRLAISILFPPFVLQEQSGMTRVTCFSAKPEVSLNLALLQ